MEFRNAIKKEVKHVIDFLPQAFKQFFRVVEDKNLTPDEITQRKRELKKLNPEVSGFLNSNFFLIHLQVYLSLDASVRLSLQSISLLGIPYVEVYLRAIHAWLWPLW